MSGTLSECCVSGHIHQGTPKGTVDEIAGLKTYVSKPQDGSKARTVIFITDIFGYELPNVRLLADEYAAQGFYCLIPDLFNGDYVDAGLLKSIAPQKSDPEPSLVEKGVQGAKVAASLGPWVAKHREAVVKPLIQSFVNTVKSDSQVGKVGSVGFCWGGRYTILLGSENDYPSLDAGVANHPSFLAVPDEVKPVNKPMLIQVGDADQMMSMEQVEETKKIWAGKTNAEVIVYPDATHGFSVRGDQNNEQEKKWKDKSTEEAIKFFKKHLA